MDHAEVKLSGFASIFFAVFVSPACIDKRPGKEDNGFHWKGSGGNCRKGYRRRTGADIFLTTGRWWR